MVNLSDTPHSARKDALCFTQFIPLSRKAFFATRAQKTFETLRSFAFAQQTVDTTRRFLTRAGVRA
jgi:hypothetical protein